MKVCYVKVKTITNRDASKLLKQNGLGVHYLKNVARAGNGKCSLAEVEDIIDLAENRRLALGRLGLTADIQNGLIGEAKVRTIANLDVLVKFLRKVSSHKWNGEWEYLFCPIELEKTLTSPEYANARIEYDRREELIKVANLSVLKKLKALDLNSIELEKMLTSPEYVSALEKFEKRSAIAKKSAIKREQRERDRREVNNIFETIVYCARCEINAPVDRLIRAIVYVARENIYDEENKQRSEEDQRTFNRLRKLVGRDVQIDKDDIPAKVCAKFGTMGSKNGARLTLHNFFYFQKAFKLFPEEND